MRGPRWNLGAITSNASRIYITYYAENESSEPWTFLPIWLILKNATGKSGRKVWYCSTMLNVWSFHNLRILFSQRNEFGLIFLFRLRLTKNLYIPHFLLLFYSCEALDILIWWEKIVRNSHFISILIVWSLFTWYITWLGEI